MRDCIEYSKHIYTSKSSAMRAAKNAIGREVGVVNPQIGNSFDATLIITENMLDVSPCEGGWRWSFSYGQEDVTPYTPCGDNVPSGEACASAIETTTADSLPVEPLSLPVLVGCIETYRESVERLIDSGDDKALAAYIDGEFLPLITECEVLGVTMGDVDEALGMVHDASGSMDPSWIAKVMVKTERFGLDHRLQRQLSEQASRRGVSVAYCLQSAREHLQRCAV